MSKLWRIIRLLVIPVSLIPVFIPMSAMATIDQPDSTPSISNVFANRYLLAEGDMLVYGIYNIPYSYEPETPASDAFAFRLLSSDGETEYASIKPYVYFSNGYNKGVFSFYLTDDAIWGQELIIRISENPAMFEEATNFDYNIGPSNFSEQETQDDNRTELTAKIILVAQAIQPYYPAYSFLQSSSGTYILSSPTGESYFTGAIPLLQYMAPSLFLLQSYTGDIAPTDWSMEKFDEYEQRFNDSWVGTSTNYTANEFNVTPMMITSLVCIVPLCVGAIVVSSRKWQRAEPGFVFCSIVLMLGAVMGWLPAAIFASIDQLLGIYLAYVIFYARG